MLANIYLDPLDHLMAGQGYEMVRYADDFVILCRSGNEAERRWPCVQQWVAEAGLTLHPDKTRIVDATQRGGFDFLGYHFERGLTMAAPEEPEQKLKEAMRAVTQATSGQSAGKDHHASSIPSCVAGLGTSSTAVGSTLGKVDGWVRSALAQHPAPASRHTGTTHGSGHINDGQTLTLRGSGCSAWKQPETLNCQSSQR